MAASLTSTLAMTTKNDDNVQHNEIRAISLDVTGTLLATCTEQSISQRYHEALLWARFPNPPTQDEMKSAFKTAYKERCMESPCFGGVEGITGREWWQETIKRVLEHSGRSPPSDFSEEDFDRYFRRIYQHFGSPQGYTILDDAEEFLNSLHAKNEGSGTLLVVGITSNTPIRHMESILPMLGLHGHFHWFTCSQEVAAEKPSPLIFEDAYQKAKFWIPDLQKHQVLHIGDSLACDFCGAKSFGFQALLLDRRDNRAVRVFQNDGIEAPDYPGKSQEDVEQNTITSLLQIWDRLNVKKG